MTTQKLWLDPVEVAPIIGESVYSICRDIRLGQFPFKYERIGRRYKISARSLGLITDTPKEETQKSESKLAGNALILGLGD